jgi:tRNA A-37 threonylcarbamoyl transferase component Bud32/TolB-like protein/Flp pilus assembly protein TadD
LGQDIPEKEGETLLHYRLRSRLGEGGMGVVYLAEDTRLGRTVALKVLREEYAADEEWNRRFQREARAVSAVNHPGVATLFDIYEDGARLFYTMEYVEGKNLREVLKGGPLPVQSLLYGSQQVAEALTEAHRKGIVHRDLKPENVVESDSGYYKILDFGLARFVPEGIARLGEDGSQLETITRDTTQAGKLVGTVSYMSPEQAQGKQVDARSDIFAFGSLVYELATGDAPFRRNNAIATFHAIVHEEPKPLRELRPELPEALEWIVNRCLAKDTRRRYQSAAELAEDLRALCEGRESGVRRIYRVRPGTTLRRAGWRPWAIGAGLAAVMMIALAAVMQWTQPPTVVLQPEQAGRPVPVLPASSGESQGTIVVSTFANNTGDTANDWLSQGVPEMLTTELAGSGDLKVVSTQRLNDLLAMAERDAPAGIDAATTTEVARWAGAGIVIGGSIYKAGDSYRIDAQASDTRTGQVLTAAKVEGRDIFQMVDHLTADLRKGLNIAEEEGPPIGVVTTSSPEAYRHYTEGMNLYKDLHFDEAAQAFLQSVEADPLFSLAGMRLGMSLYLDGKKNEGLEQMRRAAKQPERMPERDKRLAGVVTAYFGEETERATQEIARFDEVYPEDQEAHFWKAQAAADAGKSVEAVRVLSEVVRKEPDNLPAVQALSEHLIQLGNPAHAATILTDYRQRHPHAAGPLTKKIKECEAAAREQEQTAAESEDGAPGR